MSDDLNKMMQQALVLQQKLHAMQEGLGRKTVTGEAGGGVVKVTINGQLEVVGLFLDPSVVDRGEVALLQEMLVSATNAAIRDARALAEQELGAFASGMGALGGSF